MDFRSQNGLDNLFGADSSVGDNIADTIPLPSDYKIFSGKIANLRAADVENITPGSAIDLLIKDIEKTVMMGYRELDEKEMASHQLVAEVQNRLQVRQERLRRQEESSTLLIDDLAGMNDGSNDCCAGYSFSSSIPISSAAINDADYPTAWKRAVDQLFAQLTAIRDDQGLSNFHHAASFAKYSVGHRMTRFIDESHDNLRTLKELQGEISRVNVKCKMLRALRLSECGRLDPLALLVFMEDNVFYHFPGYKSALEKMSTEKRDVVQIDEVTTRQQKWRAALMCCPALTKALNTALAWAKSKNCVGPLPEIASKTVKMLEDEDPIRKAERKTKLIFEGMYKSTDCLLISKGLLGLVSGDFLVGVCHFVGIGHVVDYDAELVDYDYPDTVEASSQTD